MTPVVAFTSSWPTTEDLVVLQDEDANTLEVPISAYRLMRVAADRDRLLAEEFAE